MTSRTPEPVEGEEPVPADAPQTEALVRLVAPAKPVRREVDPEDWQRSGGSDDERYQRERPPHWE